MSAYMTEEEQLERIKQWWVKYGTPITVVVSVLLLAWSGYKYWGWHQEKVLGEASKVYENLIFAASKEDNKGLRAFANQLIHEYPKTIYAEIARLSLAKFYVERGQGAKAKEMLAGISSQQEHRVFKDLAEIRTARILISEKAYNEALTILKGLNHSPFNPIIHELEGDLYVASNQFEQALVTYQLASGEVQALGLTNTFLDMKINDLAARVGSIVPKKQVPSSVPHSKSDEDRSLSTINKERSQSDTESETASDTDEERAQSEIDTD